MNETEGQYDDNAQGPTAARENGVTRWVCSVSRGHPPFHAESPGLTQAQTVAARIAAGTGTAQDYLNALPVPVRNFYTAQPRADVDADYEQAKAEYAAALALATALGWSP